MTAQIGILNKKAIALATDSAVTISNGGQVKVLNTAEKLFELIPGLPVGIMTYNSAEFMGIPTEVIIKQYRKTFKEHSFQTLGEYVNNFVEYISRSEFITKNNERMVVIQRAQGYLNKVLKNTIDQLPQDRALLKEEIKNLVLEAIEVHNEYLLNLGVYEDYSDLLRDDYLKEYDEEIKKLIEPTLNVDLSPEEVRHILEIIKYGLLSNDFSEAYTGLVFAGFGDIEIFSNSIEIIVDMILDSKIKKQELSHLKVGLETNAILKFYAQSEMGHTFIYGMHPEINSKLILKLEEYLSQLPNCYDHIKNAKISDKSMDETVVTINEDVRSILMELGESLHGLFCESLKQYQRELTSPFIDMISSLDKQQLADLAENLINLTSLKRKMSYESETVGGPIDVAIITKNEGLIWIKRKYYFDRALNPYYNCRKRSECYDC